MLKRLIVALSVLLLSSIAVFAEAGFDDQGNPNDPTVNERANACYEGASMENRCQTELDWQAGWYLIRFEFGLLSREEVPSWVAWVLPPEILAEVKLSAPTSPSTCALAWNPNFYVDFSKSNFVGSGNYWSDTACTVPNGSLSRKWVFSPSGQANATTICVANMGAGYAAIPSHGPLVFECVI
jgi:hypothetical protein